MKTFQWHRAKDLLTPADQAAIIRTGDFGNTRDYILLFNVVATGKKIF